MNLLKRNEYLGMEGIENENSVSWRSLLLTLFGGFILCFSIIAIIHAEIVKPKDRGPGKFYKKNIFY